MWHIGPAASLFRHFFRRKRSDNLPCPKNVVPQKDDSITSHFRSRFAQGRIGPRPFSSDFFSPKRKPNLDPRLVVRMRKAYYFLNLIVAFLSESSNKVRGDSKP